MTGAAFEPEFVPDDVEVATEAFWVVGAPPLQPAMTTKETAASATFTRLNAFSTCISPQRTRDQILNQAIPSFRFESPAGSVSLM